MEKPIVLFADLDREWALPFLSRALEPASGDPDWQVELHRKPLDQVLERLGPDADRIAVVSPFISSRLGKTQFDRMPNLKLVATRSTGFDHIDLEEARKRNIQVRNVPVYGDNTVAEHTFALILSLSRKLRETYERVRRDEFNLVQLEGFDLRNKILGVVGTGHIGLRVIQIARGFSMRVMAHDPVEQPLLADMLGFDYLPLTELLRQSDIVSLHAPHNRHTHHMINADTLACMKPGALLINTARGALVDTDALVRALADGHLGGAGLDVLEHEAMLLNEDQARAGLHDTEAMRAAVLNHILLGRDNVIFTPHLAFNSREANERILTTTVENIRTYFENRTQNLVTSTGDR